MRKYLLDTCALLWLSSEPDQLSLKSLEVMESPKTQLLLSPVSTWEIAIKMNTKKNTIVLKKELSVFVAEVIKEYVLTVLPLQINHSIGIEKLPMHHADLFDRLIISISNYERIPVISSDDKFDMYEIERVW